MDSILVLLSDPAAWAALVTLIVLEVVLGIDNLIFLSILTNKLPEKQQPAARKIGLSLALIMRLVFLSMIAWLVGLKATVIDLGLTGPMGEDGHATFETAFSIRDLIMIGGGLFLIWKSTREIHENVDARAIAEHAEPSIGKKAVAGFAMAIVQIILLDLVFSIDSILTAVGMTGELPIMFAAVIVAIGLMMVAAGPLAAFIKTNPTVVMLALGFLLMVGAVLIADGFGVHVPKGYIYTAMAFSALVEGLNMMSRKARNKASNEESAQ